MKMIVDYLKLAEIRGIKFFLRSHFFGFTQGFSILCHACTYASEFTQNFRICKIHIFYFPLEIFF